MKKTTIIGIAGGTASGKTSISRQLQLQFQDVNSVTIIRQDDYYKDQSHLTMEERVLTNYDHPFAFDNDLFLEHLNKLINGEPIEKPIYDFVNHTRSSETETIYPCDVIVIEGLFILEDEKLRNICDIRIFVDTDADVRFIRRLMRDVKKRGRTLDSVVQQYTTTVKLMHDTFIEPSKKYADIIVKEDTEYEEELDNDIAELIDQIPELGVSEWFTETLGATITSDYGERIHPITGKASFHKGIDYGAPANTPIRTMVDGIITRNRYDSSYGNYVYLMDEQGKIHIFAHMAKPGNIPEGEFVIAGQQIGVVGTTGDSTGNHLHYEVRIAPWNSDNTINPESLSFQ